MNDEMTQKIIGSGPNEDGPRELPLIGKVGRNDILGIVAMENFEAYGESGFGASFQLSVDDVVLKGQVVESENELIGGEGVEEFDMISGTLVGRFPSWARRKRLRFENEFWRMNLGGEWSWSKVLVVREGAENEAPVSDGIGAIVKTKKYGHEEGDTCPNCHSVIRRIPMTDLRSDDAKRRHPLTEEQKTMLFCRCCHPGDTMIGGFF